MNPLFYPNKQKDPKAGIVKHKSLLEYGKSAEGPDTLRSSIPNSWIYNDKDASSTWNNLETKTPKKSSRAKREENTFSKIDESTHKIRQIIESFEMTDQEFLLALMDMLEDDTSLDNIDQQAIMAEARYSLQRLIDDHQGNAEAQNKMLDSLKYWFTFIRQQSVNEIESSLPRLTDNIVVDSAQLASIIKSIFEQNESSVEAATTIHQTIIDALQKQIREEQDKVAERDAELDKLRHSQDFTSRNRRRSTTISKKMTSREPSLVLTNAQRKICEQEMTINNLRSALNQINDVEDIQMSASNGSPDFMIDPAYLADREIEFEMKLNLLNEKVQVLNEENKNLHSQLKVSKFNEMQLESKIVGLESQRRNLEANLENSNLKYTHMENVMKKRIDDISTNQSKSDDNNAIFELKGKYEKKIMEMQEFHRTQMITNQEHLEKRHRAQIEDLMKTFEDDDKQTAVYRIMEQQETVTKSIREECNLRLEEMRTNYSRKIEALTLQFETKMVNIKKERERLNEMHKDDIEAALFEQRMKIEEETRQKIIESESQILAKYNEAKSKLLTKIDNLKSVNSKLTLERNTLRSLIEASDGTKLHSTESEDLIDLNGTVDPNQVDTDSIEEKIRQEITQEYESIIQNQRKTFEKTKEWEMKKLRDTLYRDFQIEFQQKEMSIASKLVNLRETLSIPLPELDSIIDSISEPNIEETNEKKIEQPMVPLSDLKSLHEKMTTLSEENLFLKGTLETMTKNKDSINGDVISAMRKTIASESEKISEILKENQYLKSKLSEQSGQTYDKITLDVIKARENKEPIAQSPIIDFHSVWKESVLCLSKSFESPPQYSKDRVFKPVLMHANPSLSFPYFKVVLSANQPQYISFELKKLMFSDSSSQVLLENKNSDHDNESINEGKSFAKPLINGSLSTPTLSQNIQTSQPIKRPSNKNFQTPPLMNIQIFDTIEISGQEFGHNTMQNKSNLFISNSNTFNIAENDILGKKVPNGMVTKSQLSLSKIDFFNRIRNISTSIDGLLTNERSYYDNFYAQYSVTIVSIVPSEPKHSSSMFLIENPTKMDQKNNIVLRIDNDFKNDVCIKSIVQKSRPVGPLTLFDVVPNKSREIDHFGSIQKPIPSNFGYSEHFNEKHRPLEVSFVGSTLNIPIIELKRSVSSRASSPGQASRYSNQSNGMSSLSSNNFGVVDFSPRTTENNDISDKISYLKEYQMNIVESHQDLEAQYQDLVLRHKEIVSALKKTIEMYQKVSNPLADMSGIKEELEQQHKYLDNVISERESLMNSLNDANFELNNRSKSILDMTEANRIQQNRITELENQIDHFNQQLAIEHIKGKDNKSILIQEDVIQSLQDKILESEDLRSKLESEIISMRKTIPTGISISRTNDNMFIQGVFVVPFVVFHSGEISQTSTKGFSLEPLAISQDNQFDFPNSVLAYACTSPIPEPATNRDGRTLDENNDTIRIKNGAVIKPKGSIISSTPIKKDSKTSGLKSPLPDLRPLGRASSFESLTPFRKNEKTVVYVTRFVKEEKTKSITPIIPKPSPTISPKPEPNQPINGAPPSLTTSPVIQSGRLAPTVVSALSNLKRRLHTLEDMIANKGHELLDWKDKKSQIQQTLLKLSGDYARLELDFKKQTSKNDQLQERINASLEIIRKLTAENEELKSLIAEYSKINSKTQKAFHDRKLVEAEYASINEMRKRLLMNQVTPSNNESIRNYFARQAAAATRWEIRKNTLVTKEREKMMSILISMRLVDSSSSKQPSVIEQIPPTKPASNAISIITFSQPEKPQPIRNTGRSNVTEILPDESIPSPEEAIITANKHNQTLSDHLRLGIIAQPIKIAQK